MKNKKEYRSMAEFNKQYFPNAYKEEQRIERDPQIFGTGLVDDLMKGIDKELKKRRTK